MLRAHPLVGQMLRAYPTGSCVHGRSDTKRSSAARVRVKDAARYPTGQTDAAHSSDVLMCCTAW